MDVLKVALFVVMAASLGLMWHERDAVVDAYRQDDDGPVELRLSGVTLDFEKTDLPASPYVVHTAPDTRRRPMSLLFTAPTVDPVSMVGGESKISGVVRLDAEPASGAIVRLERHTDDGVGTRDVLVGADGRFAARNLPGGRYRVRAWIPGVATMTESDVFFLNADESTSRSYSLLAINPDPRVGFVNGGTMTVGLTGSFGVAISRQQVDADGIVITVPVPTIEVSATFSAEVEPLSPLVTSTDDRGLAQFRMRCVEPRTGTATVTIGEEVQTVALANCVPPPPPAPPADQPGPAAGEPGTAGADQPPAGSNEEGPNG